MCFDFAVMKRVSSDTHGRWILAQASLTVIGNLACRSVTIVWGCPGSPSRCTTCVQSGNLPGCQVHCGGDQAGLRWGPRPFTRHPSPTSGLSATVCTGMRLCRPRAREAGQSRGCDASIIAGMYDVCTAPHQLQHHSFIANAGMASRKRRLRPGPIRTF